MLDNLKRYRIILASNSPRRKLLLSGLDIDYEVKTLPDIDESYPADLQGADIPLFISQEKANAYRPLIQPNELIITADTIVWLKGKAIGKPKDKAEAVAMLHQLSGNTHQVFTGVTLTTKEWQRSFSAKSDVTFSTLSDEEIDYYVEKYSPLDKAGAYGAQEWIGYIGVEHMNGSYFNVMGLPIQRLYKELKKI